MHQLAKATGAVTDAPSETSSLAASLSDEAIIDRVKAGDLAAFELIMRRHNQRLYRVARGIVQNDHDAEDVVQETYVRGYERLAQFEGRAQFVTWLTKIAVNEAITRRGKSRRLELLEDDAHAMSTESRLPEQDPQENASLREIGKLLLFEIDRLPADLRVVFILRAVEELDTKETADCLDMSESNVKIRLHRARATLRARIDKRIGEDVRKLYQFDGARCDRIVSSVLARLTSLPRRNRHLDNPLGESTNGLVP